MKAKRDPADSPSGSARPAVERAIQRLRDDGCRFPVSRQEVMERLDYQVTDATIQELARRRLLVLSEAWDGSLPPSINDILETAGITGRKDFREKYLTGKFDLSQWRHCGKVMQARLLAWAGLPVPDGGKREAKLNLTMQTWDDMDALVKERGLQSRDELVTRMVAEARAAETSGAIPLDKALGGRKMKP